MSILETPAVLVVLVALLLIGFASACAARLSVGLRCQRVYQGLFLLCLLMVGALMVASLGLAPCFWVIPAIVFSTMVLLATCEFGRSRQATVF